MNTTTRLGLNLKSINRFGGELLITDNLVLFQHRRIILVFDHDDMKLPSKQFLELFSDRYTEVANYICNLPEKRNNDGTAIN